MTCTSGSCTRSTDRSTVTGVLERDGRTLYSVYGAGDADPTTENDSVTALVDSRGVVHELERRYDSPETNVSVVVTVTVSSIGSTSVERPTWVEGARPGTTPTKDQK